MWSGVELSLESGDFQVKWAPFISLPIKKREILVKLEVWISSVPFYRSIRMDTSPKLCTARRGHTHTHARTHTHTHTLSLSLSLSMSLPLTHSLSHSLSLSLCLCHSLTHSLSLSLSLWKYVTTIHCVTNISSKSSTVAQIRYLQAHRAMARCNR